MNQIQKAIITNKLIKVRMNKLMDLVISVCLILGLVLIDGCKKDPSLAILTTSAPKNPTINSVISGGSITSSGGADVTARGVCYGTTTNPTTASSTVPGGTGTGSFDSEITGLDPNTKYYIRAYATNSAGTAYGNQVEATTTALAKPSVTTATTVTNITFTTAVAGGTITADGGDPVTARGVCWSLNAVPTIADNKADGTGTTTFTANLTSLTAGTLYYYCAFATNSVGTSYGTILTFSTTALAAPTVTTAATVTNITFTTATAGGEITSSGGADITVGGICWSTSLNPTTSDPKTTNVSAIGSFTSNLTNLDPGKQYHVRAYATNSIGTGYGTDVVFTTDAVRLATVTTKDITAISYTSAASGGNISDAGGGTITAKGVCWAKTTNPTINDSYTDNGTGMADFASNLTSLTQNTTYHVKAYATNSAGTAYGTEVVFTTTAVALATLSTNDATLITATTARSGGNITNAGGGNISARGVCWSESPNPTIDDPKSSNGTGTGPFSSDMSGLKSGTLYHIRAYATNEAGPAYGNDATFTTVTVVLPTVTTAAVNAITASSASSGGNVTDTGNGTISAKGVCWATSSGPIATGSHTTDGTGSGSFTSDITGLAGNTTYFLRAYATNSAGTNYGSETTFTTYAATDADGNNYTSVTVGAQTWLVENLKTTRYRNGELIGTTVPMNLDITTAISPKYQWPCGGNESYVAEYGRFYTYWAVTDSRNICPTGWHLPSDPEWTTFINFLGGASVAGGKIKETGTTHWLTPNTGATNETGFTALPGGYRSIAGAFVSLTITGYFWSSTQNPTPDWAWGVGLHNNDAVLLRGGYYKNDGASVRCLKD
jgi:uncharacterized protein (TIGR02145 family)